MPEKLFVSILEGRNLAVKDSNGLSDPFVKVRLGKVKHTTKVIYKTLNPKYEGETFNYDITTLPKTPLKIECWDHDTISSNDFMGQFELPVPDIQKEINEKFGNPNGHIQKWYPLKSRGIEEDGDISGELLIRFEVISGNTDSKTDSLFYKWFPEIPHSETEIQEWTCVREGKLGIPTTGHFHLTQNYVLFHPSNYIVTSSTVVIPLKDLTDIQKKFSNVMLPTGIELTTTRKKYWFSGFVHRNTVLRMIKAQWKNGNASSLVDVIAQNSERDLTSSNSSSSLQSDVSVDDAVSTPPSSRKSLSPVSLNIQPESVPELGLSDEKYVSVTVMTPATVRDIFAAIHEKGSQDIPLSDLLSYFEIGIPKKKKGFELSINPLNVALNVGHTVTSYVQAGFASRRKVKLVLDETKPLSFYNIKAGDNLILRKKVASKTFNLKFELPKHNDLVAASFDSSTQVKVIMEEMGKRNGAEYNPSKYHMMLAKQNSRGIIMEPEGILGNYVLTDQDIIRIKETCPFTTIKDVYECYNHDDEHLAVYESAIHSLYSPVAGKKISPAEAKEIIQKLKERLEISNEKVKQVDNRLEAQQQYSTEVQLIELFHRLGEIPAHPFYKQDSFDTEKQFEQWKELEKTNVTQIVNNLAFKPEVFFGMLTVTVLEANGVVAVDYIGGKSDPYCILELDGEKKITRARKRTLDPVWNETFVFGVRNVDTKLHLTLMDQNRLEQDNFLAKLTIPLRDISNGVPVMGWFNLPTKGKIRLHMQFSHLFSKYIHQLSQPIPAPHTASIDHHRSYKILLQVLIEFDNGRDNLLSETSAKLLDEFTARYGITATSVLVIDLNVLSKQFKPNEQYIEWLEDVLNDTEALKDKKAFNLTSIENKILTNAANVLLDKLVDTVEQYKQLFPQNNPPKSLSIIVACITLLLQLKKSEETPAQILLPAVKDSLQIRFDALLREVTDKSREFGINEVVDLIEKLKVEHEEDLYYENVFPSEIDVVREASKLYLARLQEKVAVFCTTAHYSPEAIDLYYKVRELEAKLNVKGASKIRKSRVISDAASPKVEQKAKTEEQVVQQADPIEVAFKPIIYGWLKDLEHKLRTWCEKACELDKGESIGFSTKHSPSVVDVFSSCRQAFTDMESLKVKDSFITVQFLEIISQVVSLYAKLQSQHISKPIETFKAEKIHDKPFTFSPQLCVYLNNIQAARGQLDELISTVEPGATRNDSPKEAPSKRLSLQQEVLQSSQEMCIQNAFSSLKSALYESQDLLVRVLRDEVDNITQKHLLGVKEGNKRASKPVLPPVNYTAEPFAEAVTQYLDAQLDVLSDKLEDKVFSSFMRRLWDAIVEDLVEIVLPHKDFTYSISAQQTALLNEHLNSLKEYFHASGSGVAMPHLDKSSNVLKSVLQLYAKDTQVLLDLYADLLERPEHPQYPGLQAAQVVKIIATRATADKEAKVIVKNFYAKNEKAKEEDKKIKDLLLLPASETIIDSYMCTYDGKTGKMILTSNYLCFDPLMGGGPDSDHQIALKFTEMTEIKKKRVMLVFAAMEVTTEDKKTYLFSSFVDRDSCLADIRLQITKKGNTKVVIEQ